MESQPDRQPCSRAKVENAGERGTVVLLTDEDAKAIREHVPDIQYISREVFSNVTLVAGNASWTTQYWGVDASYGNVYDVKTSEGRFFDEGEVRSGAKVIVLGARSRPDCSATSLRSDRAHGRRADARNRRTHEARLCRRARPRPFAPGSGACSNYPASSEAGRAWLRVR